MTSAAPGECHVYPPTPDPDGSVSPYLTKAIESVPLDYQTSALTGWTRGHYEAMTSAALLALRPYASSGRSRFYLPGPASASQAVSDSLEAFARSFLGASFLLAGGAADPHDFAGWYASGITAGADPSSYDAWPRLTNLPQARVEASLLAIGLHHTRDLIWDQLSSSTQEQVIAWLSESNQVIYPRSNWVLFFATTQAFLRSVGAPTDEERVENCLRIMEDCYLGEGWYSDGPFGPGELPRGPQVDWYQSFGIHHFFARYAAMTPGLDAERRQRWLDRLAQWASRAITLFDANGGPLFQGRSLTYRFAVLAGLMDAGLAQVGPAPGQIRRVSSGTMRYFQRARAFDAEGLLSIGWHGPHERVRQFYSGPGSPYWALHAMVGLLVGRDHPLWSDAEQPAPVECAPVRIPVKGCSWLITSDMDGITRVSNHGVDHVQEGVPGPDPLYDRLAYSTATAPVELDRDARIGDTQIGDNRVVLQVGRRRWARRLLLESSVGSEYARSRWLLDDAPDAPVVSCVAVPRGAVEVRLVRVDSAPSPGAVLGFRSRCPSPGEPVTLTVSGWPLSAGLTGQISGLAGVWTPGREEFVHQPMADRVWVPNLTTEVLPGRWVAVAVSLTRAREEPELPTVVVIDEVALQPSAGHAATGQAEHPKPASPVVVGQLPASQRAQINWPDGHVDTIVLPRWL